MNREYIRVEKKGGGMLQRYLNSHLAAPFVFLVNWTIGAVTIACISIAGSNFLSWLRFEPVSILTGSAIYAFLQLKSFREGIDRK
jgi:hypothetical protein